MRTIGPTVLANRPTTTAKIPNCINKHAPACLKEKCSWSRFTTPSHYSLSTSPYLSRDEIQLVSKYVTEKRMIRMTTDDETRSKTSGTLSTTAKRKVKHSVLTLPQNEPPPPSLCKHCHEALDLCEKCRSSKSKICHTKRVRTAIGDKLATDSELEPASGNEDNKLDKSEVTSTNQTLLHSLTDNPRIISTTMMPDKELSCTDVWNFLTKMNQKHPRKGKKKSEESLFTKMKNRRKKKQNTGYVESRRTEEITYLSSYQCSSNKYTSVLSNTMNAHSEAIGKKAENNASNNRLSKRGQFSCSRQDVKSMTSGQTYGTMGDLTNTYDSSGVIQFGNKCTTRTTKKDIQKHNIAAALARNLPLKLCNQYDRCENKINSNKTHSTNKANRRSAPSKNKKSNKRITFVDIKKKLGLLKFPITVVGNDSCASVILINYEAPQFDYMPQIWKYMSGWSTCYKDDNVKPNKYLKLLQKQVKICNRTYRGLFKTSLSKKHQTSGTNNNRVKSKVPVTRSFATVTDHSLRVIFKNVAGIESNTIVVKPDLMNTTVKSPKIMRRQSKQKSNMNNINDITQTNHCPSETNYYLKNFTGSSAIKNTTDIAHSTDSRAMGESVMSDIRHRRGLGPCGTKSSLMQSKLDSVMQKLENNCFYDYNLWIENSSSKSRKYSYVKNQISSLQGSLSASKCIYSAKSKTTVVEPVNTIKKKRRILSPKQKKKLLNKMTNSNTVTTQLSKKSLHTLDSNFQTASTTNYVKDAIENKKKLNNILVKILNDKEIVIHDILKNVIVSFDLTDLSTSNELISKDCKFDFIEEQTAEQRHFKCNFKLSTLILPQQICSYLPLLLKTLEKSDAFLVREIEEKEIRNIEIEVDSKVESKPSETNFNSLEVTRKVSVASDIAEENTINGNFFPVTKLKEKPFKLEDISIHYDRKFSSVKSVVNVFNILSSFEHIYRPYCTSIAYYDKHNDENYCNYKKEVLHESSPLWPLEYINVGYTTIAKDENKLPIYILEENASSNTSLVPFSASVPLINFAVPLQLIQNFIILAMKNYFPHQLNIRKNKKRKRNRFENYTNRHRIDHISFDTRQRLGCYEVPLRERYTRKCISVGHIHEHNLVKLKHSKRKYAETPCNVTKVKKVKDVKDFVRIIGGDNSSIFSDAINGQLANKIFINFLEFTKWSEYVTPVQALLILLLSSKPETPALDKYRLRLVHGIATRRICTSAELDQECTVVEQDPEDAAEMAMLKELYMIAKQTASEHKKPFCEEKQHTLDCMIRRKKNPSYMRVMAKYVGLGLFTNP